MNNLIRRVDIGAEKFIGKTAAELAVIFREPDCEYSYREGICQLYSSEDNTVVVELTDGIVRKAVHIGERREAIRVNPSGTRIAYIRVVGGKLISGHIIDMSEKSIAFQIGETQPPPVVDANVELCTNLRVKRHTRIYIHLRGIIYRVNDGRLVVMLERNMLTMSYNAYVNYIEHKIAVDALGDAIVSSFPRESDPEVKIIKSDHCLGCIDNYCGFK